MKRGEIKKGEKDREGGGGLKEGVRMNLWMEVNLKWGGA